MTFSPTLACVHAHPDDESLFTAGISSHYASLGYGVVLITCTSGQLGIDGAGREGSDPDHDDLGTRATRSAELMRAAQMTGFSRNVTFGFDDSGMKGWPQNGNPRAFMNCDVEATARTLAALLDEVGASVVVTYDENGFYSHPDHIMANVVTRRAIELARKPQRLYYPVVPTSVLQKFLRDARENGMYLPAWITDAGLGTPDELVTTTIDVTRYCATKQAAIAAHESQTDNADLVTMAPELFALLFGTEYYQRSWSRQPASNDEHDLFGGLS